MRPTQLCVLGSPHLPAELDDAVLDSTRQRILAWAPDAIAIELIPGEQAFLQQQLEPEGWAEVPLFSFREPREGWQAVADLHDWTYAQARAAAHDPETSPDQRVIAWLAAFEPYTAALLADGVDLPDAARVFLDDLTSRKNERAAVALRVAHELRHRRLWHFDDFTDDALTAEDWQAIMAAHPEVPALIAPHEAREAQALASGDLWLHYLYLGSAEGMAALEALNTGIDLNDAGMTIEEVSRRRVAQWRNRNLHMAAYLRQVTGRFPGGRVLAVVGAGHARPLRAALGTDQHDLELVDVAALDRSSAG